MTEELIEVVHDPVVSDLLSNYTTSRKALEDDLKSVHDLKNKLEGLFPQDLNFRNKHIIEEKIKITSSFFSTILNFRQEINKSIVNEIDLRRKLLPSKKKQESVSNIRELANSIEQMIKKKNSTEKGENNDKGK